MNAPSLYSAEIAEHILRELRTGRSLHEICTDDGMPHRDTVSGWVGHDREGFRERFREAREIGRRCAGHLGYPVETIDRLLGELMRGRPLVEACGDPGMPDHTTVNRWVASDRHGFAARYRRAREIGELRNAAIHYTAEIAERILDEVMAGRPLSVICDAPDMPPASSVRRWIRDNRDGFADRYGRACEVASHTLLGQTLPIVDDRSNDWIVRHREDGTTETILDPQRVNRAQLRMKARHALANMLLPRKFVDRPVPDAGRKQQSEMAEILKLIDGRTRGLPSDEEPLDDL